MKRWVDWKRFILFFILFQGVLVASGCTAAWLGALQGMLPALQAVVSAILSFVMALQGKTITAEVAAKIQQITNQVSAEINNAIDIVGYYTKNATSGYLQQLQGVMQGINEDLASILQNLSITDQATVAKVTQFVGLATAAVAAILALIPMAIKALKHGEPKSELKQEDKVATATINNAHKYMQDTYAVIRSTETTSPTVNAALNTLPTSLP